MKRYTSVDDYMKRHQEWSPILIKLRKLILKTDMERTVKWGAPSYTVNGKNVVGIRAFKSYAGLWFHQGVFLSDPKNKLINAQEGKTQALRQWRFNSVNDIDEKLVLNYLEEAKANQLKGKEIKPNRKKPLIIPDELSQALKKHQTLNKAFEGMSLSCKREYAEYIGEAKKSETRERRLEKIIPMILKNKGLNDRYK